MRRRDFALTVPFGTLNLPVVSMDHQSPRSGRPRIREVAMRTTNGLLAQVATDVRMRRVEAGLTQEVLAGLSNTGLRFIRELEQGKPTLEIGKVLEVLQTLGLRLVLDVQRPLHYAVPSA